MPDWSSTRSSFLNGELIAYGPTMAVIFNEENAIARSILHVCNLGSDLHELAQPEPAPPGISCSGLSWPARSSGSVNGLLQSVHQRVSPAWPLMADALSHALLPGLAIGVILFQLAPISLFIGAVTAALMVGLGAEVISRSSRVKEETALAILYTVAFSAGTLLNFAPVKRRYPSLSLRQYPRGVQQ